MHTQIFINNEYVDAKSGEFLRIQNPHDESLVTDKVQVAGQADVNAAVTAARAAFKGPWAKFTGAERSKVMLKFADLVEARVEELWPLESKSVGLPVNLAKFTLKYLADTYRYYAGWTDKLSGEQYQEAGGNYKIVQYEPLGVCACIGAWNVSFGSFGLKTAPAVATGCTVIFKGSEKSPLGLLALGDLVKEAGFPPGVINIINGDGRTGSMLASHKDINKISFTGSATTGKKVQELATQSNLKRCTLELGGKSPSIVLEDADIENALVHNSDNFLLNSGQSCIAGSRVFVHESIAPKFIEQLVTRFKDIKSAIGDPFDANTRLGPIADAAQFQRVIRGIETGKHEAKVLVGGKRHGSSGFYVEPTIFLNPGDYSRLYRDEVFGPVLVIRTFKTEEEAIKMANDSVMGLSSSIFTASTSRALRIARQIEAGMVHINTSNNADLNVPFGGFKQSGIGREGGREGILAYLEPKTIYINLDF